MTGAWDELARAAPEVVVIGGVEVRRGSRVRLHPQASADIFSTVLAGRTGVVEGIEQDMEDRLHLTVSVDDDPGRDLAARRQPGHVFFFAPEEIEPLAQRRVLVAGIGNVFLADDGFGVELAQRLAGTPLPAGVEVVDYGIRGMDLAYAMGDGWDVVVLLDAVPRGEPPGTLSIIEPRTEDAEGAVLDAHGMDPVAVLALARTLGATPARTLVVGCEPLVRMTGDEDELVGELSGPVRDALPAAEELVRSLLDDLTAQREEHSP
jgi:hydrogenase maturation protease